MNNYSYFCTLEKNDVKKTDWWDLIDDEEKAEIEEGLSQVEKGEYKSTEEVLAKYKK